LALVASAALMSITGIGLALGYGAGRGEDPWRSVIAAWSWLPAIWAVLGVTAVLYGRRRRAASLGWAVLGGCLALTLIGDLLKLPKAILAISPYSDISGYPSQAWDWTPIVVLTALACAAGAVAWWQLRSRDIG
jgi:ABC-2 type transport system permease protein